MHVRLFAAFALVCALALPAAAHADVSFKSGSIEVESASDPGVSPGSIAALDLNKDGKIDLTTVASGGTGTFWVTVAGDGKGGFGSPDAQVLTSGSDSFAGPLLAADVDGDGAPDLLYGDGASVGALYLTKGSPSDYPTSGTPAAAGDLNGDGKPDLVLTDFKKLTILLGNGDGSFEAGLSYTDAGYGSTSAAVGDLNGDGHLDLATANPSGGVAEIWIGNGDGTLRPPASIPVATSPASIVATDLNKDGKIDIATSNGDSNDVSVLSGNGNGTFGPAGSYGVGTLPLRLVAADFNRDGMVDLATANERSQNLSVLLGTGTGAFAPAKNFNTVGPVASGSYSPFDLVTADLNRDHWPDLALTTYIPEHAGSHQGVFIVFLNAGGGNVTPPGAKCVVPNVLGKPLATAKKALKKALCKLGKVSYKPSTKKKKGRVLAESPKAGKKLAADSKVNLTVGRGPKK